MKPADIHFRIAMARAAYRACTLCERRCGVDRAERAGACGLGMDAHVGRTALSQGEEAAISPAHLLYLGGCSMRCAFCLSGDMVDAPRRLPVLSSADAAGDVTRALSSGARVLEVLGGEPSVNVLAVLELAAELPADVALAWNSNFFHAPELFPLVDGVVDHWLPDFKFGNDACARRLAGVDGYVGVVARNLRRVVESGQPVTVRHVVMPGHVDCCSRPVAALLARHFPDVCVNVHGTFVPLHRSCKHPELSAHAGWDGNAVARDLVREFGLRQVKMDNQRAVGPRRRGYAGTVFVDGTGRVAVMDPAPGILQVLGS